MTIALADDHDPSITAFGGDLLSPGWIRGTKILIADAADLGSGVYQLVAYVNGVEVGQRIAQCPTEPLGWNFSPLRTPCDADAESLDLTVDSASAPFVNGPNRSASHALTTGRTPTLANASVLVDNARPSGRLRRC